MDPASNSVAGWRRWVERRFGPSLQFRGWMEKMDEGKFGPSLQFRGWMEKTDGEKI